MANLHSKRSIWIIIIIYCILNAFFNNYHIQTKIPFYGGVAILFFSFLLIFNFKRILRHIRGNNITSIVSKLLMMFILSILWVFILWGQLPWRSMIVMGSIGGIFPLIIYFTLQKYKISTQTLVKAIIIIYILYVICYLIGLYTIPTPLFGYTERSSSIEEIADSITQRGVIRLGVPGGYFVLLIFFLILTRYKNKKIFYLLLIPVAITLLMRGTRTPFFATVIIAVIYYLWQIKHKWIIISIGIIMYICSTPIYQMILNSDSNNAIVKYVQMTSNQIERSNEKEEDIRIEMARYMFTEFNEGNILRTLFGNGVPGYNGHYAKIIEKLGDKRDYYPVDTAFTTIYVYFGIIGLILYAQLLWIVIRTKVTPEGSFAKLYIFYLYLISPANSALIFSGSLTLGIALYIIQQNQIKTNIILKNK